jgi:ABC-type multidrug transport system fused ATPase/permease subunit
MISFKKIKKSVFKIKTIYSSQNFITEELTPLKPSIGWMCFFLLLQSGLVVLLPIPIKEAIDNISNIDVVSKMVVLSLGLGCVALVFGFIEEIFHANHIVTFQTSIQQKLYKKIFKCKYSFLQTQKSINLVNHITADVKNLEFFAKGLWVVLIKSVPTLLFLLGAMYLINIYVFFILIFFFVFYFLFSKKSVQKLKILELSLLKERQDFQDISLQILEFIPVMKSLNLEKKIDQVIQRQLIKFDSSLKKQGVGTAQVRLEVDSMRVLSKPFVLLVGVYAIYLNKISLGELFLMMSYLELIQTPLREISMYLSPIAKTVASYNRIVDLHFSMDQVLEEKVKLKNLKLRNSEIAFKNVYLEFESIRIPQKESLNFKFREKEFYQIRGESGSGKSTFLKLLNGFLEPSQGKLYYGGASFKDIPAKNLREEVRVVMQEDVLLPFSIRENICLDWDQKLCDDQEIWQCLRLVNAEGFVKALPKSLDTIVGEGGHQISGGERKRLSLARGLYKSEKVKVFAFDEPTAGLDPESSKMVYENLRNLTQNGKTVFCVTHKNNNLADENSSLYFDKEGVHFTELKSGESYEV